jgi:hypothetical protein
VCNHFQRTPLVRVTACLLHMHLGPETNTQAVASTYQRWVTWKVCSCGMKPTETLQLLLVVPLTSLAYLMKARCSQEISRPSGATTRAHKGRLQVILQLSGWSPIKAHCAGSADPSVGSCVSTGVDSWLLPSPPDGCRVLARTHMAS